MKITSIECLKPIIKEVEDGRFYSNQSYVFCFRGQSNNSFSLKPQITRYRNKNDLQQIIKDEKSIFEEYNKFVENNKNLFQENTWIKNKYPESKKWRILHQGQHLGLKTRLLDWSMDWKMALLFALDSNPKQCSEDAQFWILKCPSKHFIPADKTEKILKQDPFQIDKFYLINFPYFQDDDGNNENKIAEKNRIKQRGYFSIQPIKNALQPLEEQIEIKDYLTKYVIDKDAKENILNELHILGYSRGSAYDEINENIEKKIYEINKM